MTISEAVRAALDEWSKGPDFNLADQVDWIENNVADTVEDWALENGYMFLNDEWSK